MSSVQFAVSIKTIFQSLQAVHIFIWRREELADEDIQQQIGGMGPPRDLYEMYMAGRASLFTVIDFRSRYFTLLELIITGAQMLPEGDFEALREEAFALVTSLTLAYPKPSHMEYIGGIYRMSTGSRDTGLINVRAEDIDKGNMEVGEQKSMFRFLKIFPRS